jgi:hypothetical protein
LNWLWDEQKLSTTWLNQKTNAYTRPREDKLPQDQKEGKLGQLLDRAMQKHIITTIQQEKTEENKEKS